MERGEQMERAWVEKLNQWSAKNHELRMLWDRLQAGQLPEDWEKKLPTFAGKTCWLLWELGTMARSSRRM